MNFTIILAGNSHKQPLHGWVVNSVQQWRREYMVPKEARVNKTLYTHAHVFFVSTHFI